MHCTVVHFFLLFNIAVIQYVIMFLSSDSLLYGVCYFCYSIWRPRFILNVEIHYYCRQYFQTLQTPGDASKHYLATGIITNYLHQSNNCQIKHLSF